MKIDQKYLFLTVVAGLIVILDQVSKLYVHTSFYLGESIVVIPDYFNITYVRNPAAAFGILGSTPESFRKAFFLILPPLAMVLILYLMKSTPREDRWQVLALSLIFGGALGNYIDRLQFGFVVDFLDFHYKNLYAWPAFNVADMAIVVGSSILFFFLALQTKAEWKASRRKLETTSPKIGS